MKAVLITGATGGLGSVVTKKFLNLNYLVYAPYRSIGEAENLHKEISDQQMTHLILISADLMKESGVAEVFSTIDKRPEKFYALIHLLGGIKSFNEINKTTNEDWDFLMSLNLRSYFLFAKEAMDRFEKTHEGRIISIGSMSAIKPAKKQSAYGVSKAGVIALTKILADEGRERGVTANCITPSIIATASNLEWGSKEEIKKWVTPEEIANMIMYLCSDQAKSINGSIIQMFGEMNI